MKRIINYVMNDMLPQWTYNLIAYFLLGSLGLVIILIITGDMP